MRVLLIVPGDLAHPLQTLPAAAAVAESLQAQLQVVCPPQGTAAWTLLPAVERVIPFPFAAATLADWANLLGSVREPDFQVCLNLAEGRQVDLMLSMSHIPTRIAARGFSATETIPLAPEGSGWPARRLEPWLQRIGVALEAGSFRLSLSRESLDRAIAAQPAGDGPLLLLAPSGAAGDWPAAHWQALPGLIRSRIGGLRTQRALDHGALKDRAAQVAGADVVLSSSAAVSELALLLGIPLVALGRAADTLPQRSGVQGLAGGDLSGLAPETVLQALGLG
ncbi:MAG: glycosyltransferase family 9 protein [Cyanobacteriota bacterium]